jgi:hypothetical protein
MYFRFLYNVGKALEMLTKMLSSKGNMDVNEAIKCIRMLKRYGVEGVDVALNKMLLLIFQSENSIRTNVLETFEELYFDREFSAKVKANNLLVMIAGASLTDITCIEQMLSFYLDKDLLEPEVIKVIVQEYNKSGKLV